MSRHRWIALAVVLLPWLELVLLVLLGNLTNFWVVLAVIAVTAIVGVLCITHESRRRWDALREAVRTGQPPESDLAASTLLFIGGLCLTLPGMVTDLIGLILVIPPTRRLVQRRLGWSGTRVRPVNLAQGTVVEGSVVEDDPDQPIVVRGEIQH